MGEEFGLSINSPAPSLVEKVQKWLFLCQRAQLLLGGFFFFFYSRKLHWVLFTSHSPDLFQCRVGVFFLVHQTSSISFKPASSFAKVPPPHSTQLFLWECSLFSLWSLTHPVAARQSWITITGARIVIHEQAFLLLLFVPLHVLLNRAATPIF